MRTASRSLFVVAATTFLAAGSLVHATQVTESIAHSSRERLLMDFGWHFAFGHATDAAKDFNHGTAAFSYFAKTGNGDGAAAFDFNVDFPHLSEEGRSDRYGNGQPSLVYRGTIKAVVGAVSQPVPIGRTDQYEPSGGPMEDMSGITTATELLQSVGVLCREASQDIRLKQTVDVR